MESSETDRQIHVDRQINAAKGGLTAITLLNSGSWLALLSQADKMAAVNTEFGVGWIFLAWGLGAFFGTLPWVFLYVNTLLQELNERDPNERRARFGIVVTIGFGLLSVAASLACFVAGVRWLYLALS